MLKQDWIINTAIGELLDLATEVLGESSNRCKQVAPEPAIAFANEMLTIKLREVSKKIIKIASKTNEKWKEC